MKLKEQQQRLQEQQMLYMGKFLDYIYDNVTRDGLTADELDEMEEEYLVKSSNHSDVVIGSISNEAIKSINNKDYYPKQGA